MGNLKQWSMEERWEIISPIIKGIISVNRQSKLKNLNRALIKEWVRKYKLDGIEGLKNNKITKQYSSELKEMAVKDVLMNGLSKEAVIKKYGISKG